MAALKKEKVALQYQLGGLSESNMAREDSLLKKCQAELARERDNHRDQLKQLSDKVQIRTLYSEKKEWVVKGPPL